VALIVLAFIAALTFPSEARAQTLQKAVITYSSRSIASIDLFIAQERGFFREEGLEPQLVQVRATAAIAGCRALSPSDLENSHWLTSSRRRTVT
jgi:ABC-type nitrate/sulfonate/bicarbonate transport system substrate-binding protein